MKGSYSFFFATLLYGITGYCLSRTGGIYYFEMILLWGVSFLLFYLFASRKDGDWKKPTEILVSTIIVVFLARIYLKPLGWRTDGSTATAFILRPSRLTVLVSLLFLLIYWIPIKNIRREQDAFLERVLGWLVLVVVLSHFLIQVLAVRHSPDPQIDVYSNTQLAARFLWNGIDPYAATYPDIYSGRMPYPSGFFYFPGILLWVAPFFRIFGDVRFGLAAANLLLVAAIYALLKTLNLPKKSQWLWLMIWVSFPVHTQLVECAYNESILCLCLTSALILLEKSHWLAGGILMGAGLALKQTLFPFVALFSLYPLKKRSYAFFAGALLAVCGVLLPFYLWGPKAFFYSTVMALTNQPLRSDSFSFPALVAQRLHFLLPSIVILLISALSLLLSVFKVLTRRWDILRSLVFLYGMIFFFGKQAFINYYVLFAFSLYLFLIYELTGKSVWGGPNRS